MAGEERGGSLTVTLTYLMGRFSMMVPRSAVSASSERCPYGENLPVMSSFFLTAGYTLKSQILEKLITPPSNIPTNLSTPSPSTPPGGRIWHRMVSFCDGTNWVRDWTADRIGYRVARLRYRENYT